MVRLGRPAVSTWPDLVPHYEELPDAELHTELGAVLLGAGLGVSPAERGRFRRFAQAWFENKADELTRRVHASETYRIWAATAGPGQVAEAGVLAAALREQGQDDRTAAALGVVLTRDTTAKTSRTYDVAVSFADELLGYVRSVVTAARVLGLTVFFEPDMTHEWWGRNFLVEGRKVYGQRAWHFVPFISTGYLSGPRSRDAFDTAMLAAVHRGDDYILPVLAGDARVPPELLNPAVGYLRAEEHGAGELAGHLLAKVRATQSTQAAGPGARDFGGAVRAARDHAGR
jgi:hypothetical protein